MTNTSTRGNTPFRLNLEQQKKRAKELLRAYQHNRTEAFARFDQHHPKYFSPSQSASAPGLADAQLVIARELGVSSWAKLKGHISEMVKTENLIKTQTSAPDADLRTLHIRCGSDIKKTLEVAGFTGEFLEYQDPVCQGPVVKTENYLEVRAEFIAKAYGGGYEGTYQRFLIDKQRLQEVANNFERVVLWFEHDTYDQLILIKILAELARRKLPSTLEIISLNQFPGSERFIGLGQLPPEAIYLLWSQRTPIEPLQLQLATAAWEALCSSTPEQLSVLMRQPDCHALPHLPVAIHRHLQELPSSSNGLGLTEQLILEILKEKPRHCGQVFRELLRVQEPMPWLGDLMFWYIFKNLAEGRYPLVTIQENNEQDWPHYQATISALGLEVLNGGRDYLSLNPSARWLGGVEIKAGAPTWRWDEKNARLERY